MVNDLRDEVKESDFWALHDMYGVYKEGDETNGAAVVVDGIAEAVRAYCCALAPLASAHLLFGHAALA